MNTLQASDDPGRDQVAQCVICGKSADKFRDEISRKEYSISNLCQQCQDEVFCDPMGEDD